MKKNLYIHIFILVLFLFVPRVDLCAQTDLSPTEDVCAGEIRPYRVEGFANSDIYWNVSGGVIINDGIPQGTSFNETTVASGSVFESVIQVQWGTTPGTFQLIAREETIGCISGNMVLDVTVHALPDISGLGFSISSPVCYNTSPVVTITGLDAGTAYTIGYNDNGTSKTEAVTTDGSGGCTVTVDAITADATYNIESISFNDGVTGCEANPAPSLPPKTALLDNIAPVLNSLSDLAIVDCAEDETVFPQVKSFSGLELPAARYSDNCPATFTVQYRIQLPDSSFENNYGEQATGTVSTADPSGFEFPEGVSNIYFRVIDNSGNISNEESYTVSVNHKPNPSEINY